MRKRIDYILQMIQLYSYKLPTCKIGNSIMDFREKYTLDKNVINKNEVNNERVELIDRRKIHYSWFEVDGKYSDGVTLQSVIKAMPTVKAIPKDQYESRLKADMAAMLTDLQLEIEEMPMHYDPRDVNDLIQQKIDKLREVEQ